MPNRTLDDFRYADTFDSREVIDRIEELEALLPDEDEDVSQNTDERNQEIEEATAELLILKAFAEEAEPMATDWQYGETFIRDSYWKDYAQELADDIGAIPSEYSWPQSYIDWDAAARDLQMDYSSVELEGITFWFRS